MSNREGSVEPAERNRRVGPLQVAFVLLDNFTLIAHSSAIEPLRMANQLSAKELYRWSTLSEDGEPVRASDGQRVLTDGSLKDVINQQFDIVIVCGGVAQQQSIRKMHLKFLQEQARHDCIVGGVCTGAWALAQAGLLDGYRVSVHWECIPGMQEAYPKVLVTNRLFTIDGGRITASGGTAPLDMMLNLIQRQFGRELMGAISEMFMCERVRDEREQQRIPLRHVLGMSQPKLLEVVELMEANIEEPLEMEDLAAIAGISRRQLERLFLKHLSSSPSRYYLNIRINRARQLLRQTSMMIIEVAEACGFVSTSHFSKCYRSFFGVPPRTERTCEPISRSVRGRRQTFAPEALGLASSAERALNLASGEATYGSVVHVYE